MLTLERNTKKSENLSTVNKTPLLHRCWHALKALRLVYDTNNVMSGVWQGTYQEDCSEFKHGVYGRRQTAKMTSEFVFFSSNP